MTRHRPSEILDIATRMKTDLHRPKPNALLTRTLYNGFKDSLTLGIRNAELRGEAPPAYAGMPDSLNEYIETYVEYATLNAMNLLEGAYTYHVHEDMSDVITWAASGLDETVLWNPEWLPTQVGFAYFDKPIVINDVRDREMKIHGVLWGPIKTLDGDPATAVYQLTDVHDPDFYAQDLLNRGEVTTEEYLSYGRMQLQHLDYIEVGESAGPAFYPPSPATAEKMLEEGVIAAEFINFRRVFVAYIKLMGQTLTKLVAEKPERHAAKRAKRAGLPPTVTTVTLRRVEYHHEGDETTASSPPEWSHRWIVRGHWRWQPCGSEHPLAEDNGMGGHHAHIYVQPYVKGPEDKPLVITEKVYDLSR